MPHSAAPRSPRCVQFAPLFQHPLMEDGLAAGSSPEDRQRYAGLVAKAEEVCLDCPLMQPCLHAAVVDHDVAGFVAGTTPRQRREIRRMLDVTVQPKDFDTLAGVTCGNRQVDHDELLRLRRANPDESLEQTAHRLGCSLSTVKRHLRRARAEGHSPVQSVRSDRRVSIEQVFAAFVALSRRQPARGRRAA